MILLTTFLFAVVGFLGFLILAGYIEMVERWMDSRRAYHSALGFLVFMVGGVALFCLYIGLVAQVFVWAGWLGV